MKHKTAALAVLIVAALTLSATATAKPHSQKAAKAHAAKVVKVTICHWASDKKVMEKDVPEDEVQGHFQHGDWVVDAAHPCVLPTDPGDGDDDGGGNGDGHDQDNDGIKDNKDNCPLVADPGQQDSDEDGIGNSCDASPNGDDDEGENDKKTAVCHNGSALDVDEHAVGGHLGHGDTLGACSVTPPVISPVTTLAVTPPAAPKAPVEGNSAPVLPKGIQHAIYCDSAGKALNLIFGQPITDPAYRDKGLVLAVWLKGVGAVCDAKGAAFTGQYTSGNFYGGKLEMMPAWTYTAGAGGLIYLAYPLVSA
jgi:hypothetical protein